MTLPLPPKVNRNKRRIILGVDPGNVESAWVVFQHPKLVAKGLELNSDFLRRIPKMRAMYNIDIMVIERIANYGDIVGATIFDTEHWAGRFVERWDFTHYRIYRRDVKKYLGLGPNTKDAQVNKATADHFEPYGGGKNPVKGIQKQPGPLFGVKDDIWAALAIAVGYDDNEEVQQRFIGHL